MTDLFEDNGATFSPCRQYRYKLWRGNAGRTINFISLNPSKASEDTDDPTSRRLAARTRKLGFDRAVLTNVFAYCATDPKHMMTAGDPVGPENDRFILDAARHAEMVVCGWGIGGAHMGRGEAVKAMLTEADIPLRILGLNQDGSPKHPLYIGYGVVPVPWRTDP